MTIWTTTTKSPLGPITLAKSALGLCGLHLPGEAPTAAATRSSWRRDDDAFADERALLDAYFAGEPARFAPLVPAGTPFQLEVWRALGEIPFGATISYGELARRLGRAGSARAVGAANAKNPIAIAIPCHRVVGHDGRLVGYAGGVATKRWLLDHERAVAARGAIVAHERRAARQVA
ncbi:MAG: methylated-DNA--[protein]-cysteine S-methyltransferase [Myxococcales bacterium]|nr:methylated-DNA--[protein]-cysteine S-methyltransferase [Myxococcales bacterium]